MDTKSSVDFSIFPQKELLTALERINQEKFPANYAACAAEISKRKQNGTWSQDINQEIYANGAIPSYIAAWDRYRGQWAFFWIVFIFWSLFAVFSFVIEAGYFAILVWSAGLVLAAYNRYQRTVFKCPRCLKNFFAGAFGSDANLSIKNCQHCGLAKFAVTDEK